MIKVEGLQGVKYFDFPDGQPHVELPTIPDGEVWVRARIANPHDLFELQLINDVLKKRKRHLVITYLMGARMDRRIDGLQPYTLGVVMATINSMGFNTVQLIDPHSNVPALMMRALEVPADIWSDKAIEHFDPDFLVAPDLGAIKRVGRAGERNGISVLHADKHRDPQTGHITGMSLLERPALAGAACLIVDDLCDGGATFVELAKLLKEYDAGDIALYVTHGIFSKGLPIAGIDHIYTTNSYADHETTEYLTVYGTAP